ncbi:MAG: hypothetical protein QXJ27_00070 [Thermoplasmata archaeon]
MQGKNSHEFSNLADARMQEALFSIFERPCIRLRSLAEHCGIPRSSLQRKIAALEYVVVIPCGGLLIKGMVVDTALFSLLERDSYYTILLAIKKPLSIERLCLITGREKASLYGTLRRLAVAGVIVKEREGYKLNPELEVRYKEHLQNLPALLGILDSILEKENIKHRIMSKREIFVECFGRKRILRPYRRLAELLEL